MNERPAHTRRPLVSCGRGLTSSTQGTPSMTTKSAVQSGGESWLRSRPRHVIALAALAVGLASAQGAGAQQRNVSSECSGCEIRRTLVVTLGSAQDSVL